MLKTNEQACLDWFHVASDNEVEFEVLEAVTNIHSTEFVRTLFVEKLVTGPLKGADMGIASARLQGPCSFRLVLACAL